MSQTAANQPASPPADLPRVLGVSQATAIVVGTIIGSGIFLLPAGLAPGDYTLTPWIMARWQSKEFFSLRNLETSTMSDEQKAYATVDLALRLN